jgi:hypothetical protein
MMKFRCDNGHLIEIETRAIKKMLRKAEKMLIVCQYCKPANVSLSYIEESNFSGKKYVCPENHLTTIYPFANGFCNIECCGCRENIEIEPEIIQKTLDSGQYKCYACGKPIKEIDSTPLQKPNFISIKTRTRVGDVWDKAGCPEPRDASIEVEKKGGVAYDASLNQTEFSRRNKERIKKMRKTRNTRPAGKIIND